MTKDLLTNRSSVEATGGTILGNVLRWIVFVPGAMLAYAATQLVPGCVLGTLTGLLRLAGMAWTALDIARYPVSYFFGSFSFVWTGALIAPVRKRKTAYALFWVFWILCYSIEVSNIHFRQRPVSQGTLCFSAISDALCGLCLAMYRLNSRYCLTNSAAPRAEKQNPWSGV